MIGLLNPYVWLAAVVAMLGAYGTGRWQQHQSDEKEKTALVLRYTEAARAQEARWQENVKGINDANQSELQRIAAQRDRALAGLRNRPVNRMPSTAKCTPDGTGATGAQLSGPDAEFLTRLAESADRTASDLRACQAFVKEVTAASKGDK